jgi:hypothetical protein
MSAMYNGAMIAVRTATLFTKIIASFMSILQFIFRGDSWSIKWHPAA